MTSLKDIAKYFNMTLSEFSKEWRALTDKDKADIRGGFDDGTMNYR